MSKFRFYTALYVSKLAVHVLKLLRRMKNIKQKKTLENLLMLRNEKYFKQNIKKVILEVLEKIICTNNY